MSHGSRRWMAAFAVGGLLIALMPPAAAAAPEEGGRFWDDDGWTHEGNIEAIAAIGVTQGCAPEGTAYCPNLAVTRAQMASFLARALGLPASTNNRFIDVPTDSVHLPNINAIADAGITLGCTSDGTQYCPNLFVSRAQMASFLARALELDEVSIGPFQDITADYAVHEGNINAIAQAGITIGCDAGGTRYCPGNIVIRAQMASFLARALNLDPGDVAPRLDLFEFMTCDTSGFCTGSGGHDGGPFFIRHGFVFTPDDPDFAALQTDPTTGFVLFLDGVEQPSTHVVSTFSDQVTRWDIIDFPAGLSGSHEFEVQWVRLGEVVQDGVVSITFP